MKRANWTYLIATALVLSGGISGAGAGERFVHQSNHGSTGGATSQIAFGNFPHSPGTAATTTTAKPATTTTSRGTRHIFGTRGSGSTSTTANAPTTVTAAPTTPTTPPTAAPTTPPTAAAPSATCVGTAMTQGQADINAAPANTTFCLSGTHNWTLTPKSGDTLMGPATLDGGSSTNYGIVATAANVTLTNLTIQHYNNGNGSQDGAIHIADDDSVKATASGWHLNNLDVGFNSAAGSGSGNGWVFTGGRYHDNGQEGIGGAMGTNVTINGVEVDHNDFTNTSYTTRNWSCGDEAGGVKWVTNGMTIENSTIDNNACKGVWADLNANGARIINNHISNNWDEGIFIEISSGATITGNTVTGNGFKNYNGSGTGCPWLFGGGITLAASDGATISGNTVTGNCNGITGVQQDRPDGNPGLLENDTISSNTVGGPGGVTGAATDDGANLAAAHISFTGNSIVNGMQFCNLSC
jgi:parallel beta-helix repeat protein